MEFVIVLFKERSFKKIYNVTPIGNGDSAVVMQEK